MHIIGASFSRKASCHEYNEDSQSVRLSKDARSCCALVSDGMGASGYGHVASSETVRMVSMRGMEWLESKDCDVESFMRRVVIQTNGVLWKYCEKYPDTAGMGTTLVWMLISDDCLHLAWCGDSRAYIYDRGVGLKLLSKDHSRVQELFDEGLISREEMLSHPESNLITKFIGSDDENANPEFLSRNVAVGDTLLLCSDGLWAHCTEEEMSRILQSKRSLRQKARSLCRVATYNGSLDDISVVLVKIVENKGLFSSLFHRFA